MADKKKMSNPLTKRYPPRGEAPHPRADPSVIAGPLQRLSALIGHGDYRIEQDPDFFAHDLQAYYSPLALSGMEQGVVLLRQILEDKRNANSGILVIGDRDVDGVSSTALFGRFLRDVLKLPSERIQLRVSDDGEDYGLTEEMVDRVILEDKRPAVVVLLDMGSSHGAQIDCLTRAGVPVIVLDHHEPGKAPEPGPNMAFINPLLTRERFDHQGQTPTVALVLKFMLAYTLQYTREWNTVRLIEDAHGQLVAYRLGHLLGKHQGGEATAKTALSENCPGCEFITESLEDHPELGASNRHSAFNEDPQSAGKWIFAAIVNARPRLLDLLVRYSDLATLGIIADMMPLISENRAISRLGMGLLKSTTGRAGRPFLPPLRKLLQALRIPGGFLSSRDIGWGIAPVLNAAGRMGNTALALEFLYAGDEALSGDLATELLKLNRKRKSRTVSNEKIIDTLLQKTPELLAQDVLFCYDPELKPGVSGIVATRLMEKYNRPVVYINADGDTARGSIRGAGGIDVLQYLESCSDLLIQYGGHKQAAGFSIHYEQIDLFQQALYRAFDEKGKKEQLTITAMSEVEGAKARAEEEIENGNINHHIELSASELNAGLMRELEMLEPFGKGNPEVIILVRNAVIEAHRFMSDGAHISFTVRGAHPSVRFVAWRMGAEFAGGESIMGAPVSFTGTLEWNHFLGKRELQFRIETLL